jgi:hypothetical protein
VTPRHRVTFELLPPGQVEDTCPGELHGAHESAYTHFECRCAPARLAYGRYRKHLAAGLRGDQRPIHAIGTRRRLEALAAVGYSLSVIATHCGLNEDTLRLVRNGTTKAVRPRVAAAVRDAYDRFWDVPGPSAHQVRLARRKGWPPPMWWHDDHIDNPRARGPERAKLVAQYQEDHRAG